MPEHKITEKQKYYIMNDQVLHASLNLYKLQYLYIVYI